MPCRCHMGPVCLPGKTSVCTHLNQAGGWPRRGFPEAGVESSGSQHGRRAESRALSLSFEAGGTNRQPWSWGRAPDTTQPQGGTPGPRGDGTTAHSEGAALQGSGPGRPRRRAGGAGGEEQPVSAPGSSALPQGGAPARFRALQVPAAGTKPSGREDSVGERGEPARDGAGQLPASSRQVSAPRTPCGPRGPRQTRRPREQRGRRLEVWPPRRFRPRVAIGPRPGARSLPAPSLSPRGPALTPHTRPHAALLSAQPPWVRPRGAGPPATWRPRSGCVPGGCHGLSSSRVPAQTPAAPVSCIFLCLRPEAPLYLFQNHRSVVKTFL
ncbi:uncharacterized protein LOC123576377 [Leopardus geoffroyi]|uniref:uncharacterized protein LOC123576377 n=1 Tax=Leopardus geoffroyi TaxID=46844 RepID=UPI001E25E148|nr:uncharacterized protein LOC123576377 [Leopardus geoffroyi]